LRTVNFAYSKLRTVKKKITVVKSGGEEIFTNLGSFEEKKKKIKIAEEIKKKMFEFYHLQLSN
jgi:hypothetical protein